MNIKLMQLQIENFKGIKKLSIVFDGNNAVIRGANGTCKTTIADAFSWLITDKDSLGHTNFEINPLDVNNVVIHNVIPTVKGLMVFDSETHTLHKELRENIIKGQFKGYESACFIDEVPYGVGEFNKWIAERMPSETLRLLTNLHHFNSNVTNWGWKNRRAILLKIAGNIGAPAGFDELLSRLNGRTVDQYKEVLDGQEKDLKEEQKKTKVRIDENQRTLTQYAETIEDTSAIEEKRENLQDAIGNLDTQRRGLSDQEQARQSRIDSLNTLKGKKARREGELAGDTTGVNHLLTEKSQIELEVSGKRNAAVQANSAVTLKQSEIKVAKIELDNLTMRLNDICKDYKTLRDTKDITKCYACDEPLRAEKITESQTKKQKRLAEIADQGNGLKGQVTEQKAKLESLNDELQALVGARETANIQLHNAEKNRATRFAQIDAQINSHEKPKPENDTAWKNICAEIVGLENQIGPAISDQISSIDSERSEIEGQIKKLNDILANADTIKNTKTRIEELGKQEQEIAQNIANIEKLLNDIKGYKAEQSRLIETAVNDKFKYVKFKLFDTQINGEINNNVCDAMLDGIPYADMSTGQKILVGIDIINTLSDYYRLSVPLIIDNSESFTFKNEFNGQHIDLIAEAIKDDKGREIRKMFIQVGDGMPITETFHTKSSNKKEVAA